MHSLQRLCAATALFLGACGAAGAAEITGNFTSSATTSAWAFSAQPVPGSDVTVESPTMNGTGWLTLHSNLATNQVSYATSNTRVDTMLPIRITYDWLSHTPKNFEARVAGFVLFDPAKGNDLHAGKVECTRNFLTVAFQQVGMFGESCNGTPNPWDKSNYAIVRGTEGVVRQGAAPMPLTCRNFTWWGGDYVEAEDCRSRQEAIDKQFIRKVDALLTPKLGGAGFTLDLTVDGQVVYSNVDIAQQSPAQLAFALHAAAESTASAQEVRNLRITQVTMFASEVNDRCMDVVTTGGVRTLQATTCAGTGPQIFRRDGALIRSGSTCMTIGADGTSITTDICRGANNQRWDLLADGRVRARPAPVSGRTTSPPERCITLGQDGTTLSLQACAEDAIAQRFHAVAP